MEEREGDEGEGGRREGGEGGGDQNQGMTRTKARAMTRTKTRPEQDQDQDQDQTKTRAVPEPEPGPVPETWPEQGPGPGQEPETRTRNNQHLVYRIPTVGASHSGHDYREVEAGESQTSVARLVNSFKEELERFGTRRATNIIQATNKRLARTPVEPDTSSTNLTI